MTWVWCHDTGTAGRPKSMSRHALWCRDMGGSLGGRDRKSHCGQKGGRDKEKDVATWLGLQAVEP